MMGACVRCVLVFPLITAREESKKMYHGIGVIGDYLGSVIKEVDLFEVLESYSVENYSWPSRI